MPLPGLIGVPVADRHIITAADRLVDAIAVGIASASYTLQGDGDISENVSGSEIDIGDWISPKDSFSDYEVYAEVLSGTLTIGTVDSWLPMTEDRVWTKVNASVGTVSQCELTISFRNKWTHRLMKTVTITLSAERV